MTNKNKRRNLPKKFIKSQERIINDMIARIGKKTVEFIKESLDNDLRRPSCKSNEGDAAIYFHDEAVRIGVASISADKLRLLLKAKSAILSDSYGFCTQCSGRIDKKRLMAVSWANRCKSCQEVFDRELK